MKKIRMTLIGVLAVGVAVVLPNGLASGLLGAFVLMPIGMTCIIVPWVNEPQRTHNPIYPDH